MLTRFVRTQLILFTIAAIVGVAVMAFAYMQVPTLLGMGRVNVTLKLPATGGLYQFSNVTYRGSQIGKVTGVKLTEDGAEATLSLDRRPQVPADLKAAVRSMSAVGEQYVDLLPNTNSGPYLEDGSVIAADRTSIPQAVGPMLDQVSALMDTIPKEKLAKLQMEFNQKRQAFEQDNGRRQSEERNKILTKVQAAIDSIAKSNGYDLVLERNAAPYAATAQPVGEAIRIVVAPLAPLRTRHPAELGRP